MSNEMSVEERIQRIERFCAEKGYAVEFTRVTSTSGDDDDDHDTWAAWVDGQWVDTIDGLSLLIEAVEVHLELGQDHVAENVYATPPVVERVDTQPVYPEDHFHKVDPAPDEELS